MKNTLTIFAALLFMVAVAIPIVTAGDDKKTQSASAKPGEKAEPTVDEQITGLEAMCASNAEVRAARHAEKPLFERLRGEEGIHKLTKEIVRVHLENDEIKYMFEDLDADKVAHRVALFIIAGTGGPAVYDGPELEVTHADMGLTNKDFLVAGGDIIQAMKNLEYGQEEIDEMICILVALRDRVVFEKEGEKKPAKY